MKLSNPVDQDRVATMVAQTKDPQPKRPQKRLSQKKQRVEEFLRRLEVRLRRVDRGLV